MINFKSPEEIRKENVASLQKFKPNPNNREIKKRNIFRHFKGHIYEIMNIGKDSETQEDVVIYENMETGDIWVRPLKMFLEPVDKQKYPNADQQYRFELILTEDEYIDLKY